MAGTLKIGQIEHPTSGTITVTNGALSGHMYPAFHAYHTTHPGNSLTANTATKVIFDSKYFDTDNSYDTSNGLFTVPKAGEMINDYINY